MRQRNGGDGRRKRTKKAMRRAGLRVATGVPREAKAALTEVGARTGGRKTSPDRNTGRSTMSRRSGGRRRSRRGKKKPRRLRARAPAPRGGGEQRSPPRMRARRSLGGADGRSARRRPGRPRPGELRRRWTSAGLWPGWCRGAAASSPQILCPSQCTAAAGRRRAARAALVSVLCCSGGALRSICIGAGMANGLRTGSAYPS
mmetsp:Transcript_35364/g.77363  ORF Transcript_35364/g.77363 Transcript_35364/m.77363 type:complete len:202 (+) Transcript_35364:876-1481(+)